MKSGPNQVHMPWFGLIFSQNRSHRLWEASGMPPGPQNPKTWIFDVFWVFWGPGGIPEASQSPWEPSCAIISPNGPIWACPGPFSCFLCIFQAFCSLSLLSLGFRNSLWLPQNYLFNRSAQSAATHPPMPRMTPTAESRKKREETREKLTAPK